MDDARRAELLAQVTQFLAISAAAFVTLNFLGNLVSLAAPLIARLVPWRRRAARRRWRRKLEDGIPIAGLTSQQEVALRSSWQAERERAEAAFEQAVRAWTPRVNNVGLLLRTVAAFVAALFTWAAVQRGGLF